ncbi:aminomethyltransferase beta-barrel domain-containing protein [Anaplasma phagocytophilum]|uniref:aminomethyltransferase beta-barrel domain-containing protein n=1 Tax=Anaplasma phagocytophilum TaxID=948 RepID=UPI00215574F5|nr:aminomethyltransferase beta-barrel domain-containing protein [Anaplasma phagocytophilum]
MEVGYSTKYATPKLLDSPTHAVSLATQNKASIRDLNWLSKDQIPEYGLSASVRLRSSSSAVRATISRSAKDGKGRVVLHEGCVVPPGQACVIYDNKRLLGGG